MRDPESSSLFCAVCSRTFSTPQGRAGHQSHSQDPAHRAAYEAGKKSAQNRRPTAENRPALGQPVREDRPENRPPARQRPSATAENRPALGQSVRENKTENRATPENKPSQPPAISQPKAVAPVEPLALEPGPAVRLLPATVPLRPDLGPRLYPPAAPGPTLPPKPANSDAAPTAPADLGSPAAPQPAPSARTYTAADFFTALATTPPRAGLAKWERWLLGIAILAGLALAFAWPLIQQRRARIQAERQQMQTRPATPPAPSPFPLTASARSAGYPWPPAALHGGVRARHPDPWWCL